MLVKEDICDKLSDEQLVSYSLANMDYFLCLYERYEPRLLRYIQRITRVSREQAEDILQEAFVKVWQNLKGYNPRTKLSSWLYRIVHNETISNWRKSRSFGKNQQIQLNENLGYPSMDTPSGAKEKEDEEEQVHELMHELSPKYRVVLFLKYFEDMSYQEISDVLKIPEGTVAIQLNRAKKQFKKLAHENGVLFEM